MSVMLPSIVHVTFLRRSFMFTSKVKIEIESCLYDGPGLLRYLLLSTNPEVICELVAEIRESGDWYRREDL